MRAVTLFAASFVLAASALGQEATTRIEVGNSQRAVVVLTGEGAAGQFSVRSGPTDVADLGAGIMEAPQGFAIYDVRFYCAANAPGHESIPSNQCYEVRYAVAPGHPGYVQVPDGSWYRATQRWDEAVRPRLAAAMDARSDNATPRIHQQQPRVYRQSSPSTRATGAKPTLKPKN